ncbi:MAG: ComEC/Rec2 family competence protein [Patescibacteria group bacterium]
MPKLWRYLFALLLCSLILTSLALTPLLDNRLHIVFCDVSQGDGILIYKKSVQIVLDAGPKPQAFLKCMSKHIPFWDRTIELVILSNPDRDHYGGLTEVFKSYKVESFASPGINRDDQGFKVLENAVVAEFIPRKQKPIALTSGQTIKIGEVTLDTLWPTSEWLASQTSHIAIQPSNNSQVLGSFTPLNSDSVNLTSLVQHLSYGSFDVLLTGDIAPPASYVLAKFISRPVDVLKVPHHGSKNGLTEDMLDSARPGLAVISAGKNNRYGHPHKEILEALENRGVRTLGTYDVGDIEIITDGKTWQVQTESKTAFSLDWLREKILSNFKSLLPEPHASLLSGIVLGTKSSLDSEFFEALRKTSTLHIIVASGTNVALVGGAILRIFPPYIGRKQSTILTILAICLYVLLVGLEPPIIRAAIMGTIGFTALALGRESNAIRALLISAALMLLVWPQWISDLSFQLSFLATLGVIVLGNPISQIRPIRQIPNIFKESVATSLGAQAAVAPLIWLHFKEFSAIGPVVNVLVLWTIPFIMAGGMLLGLISLISPIRLMSYPIAWFLWLPLEYFVRVVNLF